MKRTRFLTTEETNGLQTAGVKFNERHLYSLSDLEKMNDEELFSCLASFQSVINHDGDYIGLCDIVCRLSEYINNYDSKD